MTYQPFRAGVIQMRSGTDPNRNIAELTERVAEAVSAGADYVQTPEMTGALVRDRAQLLDVLADEASDPVVAAAAELAARHGIYLHIGSTPISVSGGKVANRTFLFGPRGDIVARYDKIHMFDVDLDNGESWRESATYQPGQKSVVVDLPIARLGLSICYDLRFPDIFQKQALAGANLLCVPAAFTRQTGGAHWHVLLRARAIENGAFVVAAAQGGVHEDGRETFGHSIIIDPWGRVVAEAEHDEPAVVVADIDVRESKIARNKIPNLQNRCPFEVAHIQPVDLAGVSA
ncbi:MAG: carbon-nitrogen hydrolase family protein [Pseudomonadota bacterium]